jgi:hypothetical protein
LRVRGQRNDPKKNESNRIENVDGVVVDDHHPTVATVDRELRLGVGILWGVWLRSSIGPARLKAGYREAPHLSPAGIKSYELAVSTMFCGTSPGQISSACQENRLGSILLNWAC